MLRNYLNNKFKMYNSLYDKNAIKRLHCVLANEKVSMASLARRLNMSEKLIIAKVCTGCHDMAGRISRLFGKSMIQGYLLEPGRFCYDKNGELRHVYLQ